MENRPSLSNFRAKHFPLRAPDSAARRALFGFLGIAIAYRNSTGETRPEDPMASDVRGPRSGCKKVLAPRRVSGRFMEKSRGFVWGDIPSLRRKNFLAPERPASVSKRKSDRSGIPAASGYEFEKICDMSRSSGFSVFERRDPNRGARLVRFLLRFAGTRRRRLAADRVFLKRTGIG